MSQSKLLSFCALASTLLFACEPPAVEPELVVTATPRTIDGAQQKTTVKVEATDSKGKRGTGTVRLSSPAGTLKAADVVSLANGQATAEFGCDRAADAMCNGSVRITAEWTVGGTTVTSFVNITITPPVVIEADAGVSVTSSHPQLGIGLGNSANIVARYTVDGVPQTNSPLNLTTSEGVLVQTDGGPFGSPTNTDSNGEVAAVLTDDGMAGVATVTVTGPRGRSAATSVNIYVPDGGISINAQPTTLTVGFNEVSTILVNHSLENRAVPGRPIVVESTAGRLLEIDGGSFTSPARTDVNGQIRALLTDTGSPGLANVTARDLSANVEASTQVALAPPDAGVVVATTRQTLYLGINDSVGVSATLYANGNPSPNRMLNIDTTLGTLSLADGGVFSGSGVTNNAGRIALTLRDTGMSGSAVITATDPVSNRSGSATVNVRPISTVNFVQMTCSGQPCTVLGISSSNSRTTAKLQFAVRDNQLPPQPVAGVNLAFTLNLSSALGTTIAPTSTTTDANGLAEVTVNTGNAVGSFTVTATVIAGVAATSPSFGVRGAKPTNRGFTIQCNKTTMSAYTAPTPPLPITADCVVSVVDRNNNPVGLASDVSIRSEAGAAPGSVSTMEYTTSNSASEGKASLTFSTVGDFPADNVAPLTTNTGQFPFALSGEPARIDGSLTRNPRDGLVVIIAWTRGEEWFNDLDGNGIQNGNEPFVDQGEPFVDTNDNDVFDGNDRYYNVENDGVYTPPNGVWDRDAFVWTKTYVLYTDRSALSSFTPSGPFNLAKETNLVFNVFMPDQNLNRLEVGSTVDFVRLATKGAVSPMFVNVGLDGFGFDFEPRYLTNVAGTAACPTATDRICVYKTRFGQWSAGYLGTLTLFGAPLADMNPAQNEIINVRTTTRGGTVTSTPLIGVIQ